MISYWTILHASAPVFLVMLIGAGLRQWKILPREADPGLTSLVLNFLYPVLIVRNVLGNPALKDTGDLTLLMGLGFLLLAISIGIGVLATRLLRLKRGGGRRTFPLAVGVQNYGLLPIPILAALFPAEQARELTGLMFLFILGLEIATWTVGIASFGAGGATSWRRLLNAPIFAIMASLGLNFLGAARWLPGTANETIHMLSGASIPVNLLLVGATLRDFVGECQWRGAGKVLLGSALVRFVVLPLLYFAAARWLPLSQALKIILVIQGSMPAAVFPILLAKHYGGHVPTAVQIVISSSTLGLVVVPALLMAGFRAVGISP